MRRAGTMAPLTRGRVGLTCGRCGDMLRYWLSWLDDGVRGGTRCLAVADVVVMGAGSLCRLFLIVGWGDASSSPVLSISSCDAVCTVVRFFGSVHGLAWLSSNHYGCGASTCLDEVCWEARASRDSESCGQECPVVELRLLTCSPRLSHSSRQSKLHSR